MNVWSRYDQWLTTPPEAPDIPLPGDEFYPRCGCGAFLVRDVKRELMATLLRRQWITGHVQYGECMGYGEQAELIAQEIGWEPACGKLVSHPPHQDVVVWAWEEIHRICTRCGKENIEVQA
jgi:hypothetical protein